jgi:RepB DNA-primase from phage plasmid
MTSMDRTESAVRKMLTAIEAPLYDVGVLSDRGMLPGLDSIPAAAVLDRLSLLKYRNARGSHIYIRPSGEHRFTMLDDLNETSLARLSADGFTPCACGRDQRRQLSSMAQALENLSEAPRNLCRADIGGAVQR